MTQGPGSPPLQVTVIGRNPETTVGLQDYLESAGVATQVTPDWSVAAEAMIGTTVVLVLPDEFESASVVEGIGRLRRSHPQLPIVVITAAPQRYRPAFDPDGASRLPLILPKPVFGWTVLDAVRAHSAEVSA